MSKSMQYLVGVSDSDDSLFLFPSQAHLDKDIIATRWCVKTSRVETFGIRTSIILQSEIITITLMGNRLNISDEYVNKMVNLAMTVYPDMSIGVINKGAMYIPLNGTFARVGNKLIRKNVLDMMSHRNLNLSQLVEHVGYLINTGCVKYNPLEGRYRVYTVKRPISYHTGLMEMIGFISSGDHSDKVAEVIDAIYRNGIYNKNGLRVELET